MDVNRFKNADIPICKFGPGGDFITPWPALPAVPIPEDSSADPITRILGLIGRLLGTSIQPELAEDLAAALQPVRLVSENP